MINAGKVGKASSTGSAISDRQQKALILLRAFTATVRDYLASAGTVGRLITSGVATACSAGAG